jgi:hypothetical protein
VLEDVVGPLSENGRMAFQKLAGHHMLTGDKKSKRLARLMRKFTSREGGDVPASQWELFAGAINKLPPSAFVDGPDARNLDFLIRLSKQPDACALIVRKNGYGAFATLWDAAGGRFDSLNARLRRLEKLVAEAPPEKRAAVYDDLVEKLAQKDADTLKTVENAGKKAAKTPIAGATKTLEQLKEEALKTEPGPGFKAFRDQLEAYPDYKGSVFEVWIREHVFKMDPKAKQRVYVYKYDNPQLAEEMIALERSCDAFSSSEPGKIAWWDGKVYSSKTDIDWEQALDNELFDSAPQVNVRFNKRDPKVPPGPGDPPQTVKFDEIGYIFSDIKAAKRNRAPVQTDAGGEVYYLDDSGKLEHMN